MSGGQIIGLLTIVFIFGGPMIVGIVYAIVNGWVNVQKHREDADLKHKLVDSGFTPEEIERIMIASAKPSQSESQQSDDDLKQSLADSGYSAEDIERIINAGRGNDGATVKAFSSSDAKAG